MWLIIHLCVILFQTRLNPQEQQLFQQLQNQLFMQQQHQANSKQQQQQMASSSAPGQSAFSALPPGGVMPPPSVPRSVGALPPPAPAVNPLSDVTAAAAAAQSQLNNGAFPPTAPLPPPAAHVPYLSAADGSSTHQPAPQQQQQTPPPVVAPPAANVSAAAADDVTDSNIIQTVTDQDISAFLRGDKEIAFNEDILTEFDEQTAAAATTPAAHDVSKPPCGGAGDASDVMKSDSNVAGSSISGFGDAGGGGDVDGSGGGGEITDYKLDLKDWFARIRQAYDDKLHNKNSSSSQSESDAVVKVPPPVSINMSARQILASCQNYGRYWIPLIIGLL